MKTAVKMKTSESHALECDLPNFMGGNMYKALTEDPYPYMEERMSKIVEVLLLSVQYLHSRNIAHRDIRPENIKFRTALKEGCIGKGGIALDNFTFAATRVCGENLTDPVGTLPYIAPELLAGRAKHGVQVDMWSVGVVVFLLLSGELPFEYGGDGAATHQDNEELYNRITTGKFEFLSPIWEYLHETARDFIRKLLEVDPQKRMTVGAALAHPWISNSVASTNRLPSNVEMDVRKRMLRQKMVAEQMRKKIAKAGRKVIFLAHLRDIRARNLRIMNKKEQPASSPIMKKPISSRMERVEEKSTWANYVVLFGLLCVIFVSIILFFVKEKNAWTNYVVLFGLLCAIFVSIIGFSQEASGGGARKI